MGILLSLAEIYIPGFIRRRELERLFAATADGFGTSMPSTGGLDFHECLRTYALFTKEKAKEAIQKRNESEVKHGLYRNAYHLGQGLRGELGVSSARDAMRLARLVYNIVEIDFKGSEQGEVVINRCFFSSFYSPKVCGIISSIDAGMLSGLTGGGRLNFQQRLTEGAGCCLARLSFGVKSS